MRRFIDVAHDDGLAPVVYRCESALEAVCFAFAQRELGVYGGEAALKLARFISQPRPGVYRLGDWQAIDPDSSAPEVLESLGDWGLSGDDAYAVLLDQEDVGAVYDEGDKGWLAFCGDEDLGYWPTREEAVDAVKRAVVEYRARCCQCGGPTTAEDRRRTDEEPGFEGTEVVCAPCLTEIEGGKR